MEVYKSQQKEGSEEVDVNSEPVKKLINDIADKVYFMLIDCENYQKYLETQNST